MDLIHLIVLGIVQGLTEFLPISSSAHLILFPVLLDWEDQGLVYDIAAHLGSLAAVLVYLRRDLVNIIRTGFARLSGGNRTHDSMMLEYLAIATLPVAVGGYLFYDVVSTWLRSPLVIAVATLLFGLLLGWADYRCKQSRHISNVTRFDAVMIGLAQLLSIIPGTSRSGITMTAGLLLGLDRRSAARFSFLMSIPVILLAGGYESYRYFLGDASIDWAAFSTVAAAAGITAWLAIYLFLEYLPRTGMLPYVVYRLVLGGVLLWLFI